MVIDYNLLAKAIVPQSKHYIDESFPHHLIRHNHRTRHPQMMIGMSPIIERGQGKINGSILFSRISTQRLSNLGHHEGIQTRDGMPTMVFRTSHRDNNDIVLAPVFDKFLTNCSLDIATRLT